MAVVINKGSNAIGTDDRIREDVHDRLVDDPYVDASDIEVKVEKCEVVLTGNVSDREQKRRAEDIVESISGVRHVENRLRVNQEHTAYASNQRRSYTGDTGNVSDIGNDPVQQTRSSAIPAT